MNAFLKILAGLVVFLILLSGYANFLHPRIFFSRQQITYADSRSELKGGEAISFRSGPFTLRGRLKAPSIVGRKVPAIIFSDGSGGQSSFASPFYSRFLDTLFEQNLPPDSIAFLYFEKRGVGKSDGNWYDTDFEERAADVKAAADYLKTLPFIDSSRIVVAGHSQGGWITQICLSKYPETFAGGISMAGPAFGVKEQLINDYASKLMCDQQLNESEARVQALSQVETDLLLVRFFPFQQEWHQLNRVRDFDPASYLTTVHKPLLMLFCENDALVSPKNSLARLKELFGICPPSEIVSFTIKGANHGFKLSDKCYDGPYQKLSFAEQGKSTIRRWIQTTVLR